MATPFNGNHCKQVVSSIERVRIHQAYFDTINYRRGQIDRTWLGIRDSLSKNWSSQWFDRSLCVRNDKLKLIVKITMSNEVFIDKKVGKFDFKSSRFTFESVEEATRKFEEYLSQFVYTKVVLEDSPPQPALVA
jgi:hypothetical protein